MHVDWRASTQQVPPNNRCSNSWKRRVDGEKIRTNQQPNPSGLFLV